MTSDNGRDELPPAEQPPTDDPWVIVTPMPSLGQQPGVTSEQGPRRKAFPCAQCGAYWPCEHDASVN